MRRSNADTCSFFFKPQGWRWGGGRGQGGIGRKRTLLKFCDLKGMTFTSICMYLSYAYSENLKSSLECFFLPFQKRHAVWSGLEFKSECVDILHQNSFWQLRHTDEPQLGRNSCLWLQSRSVLSSFGVVLMSCRVKFHVVRSALQYSACRILCVTCSNRTFQSDKPKKLRDVHYLDLKCHYYSFKIFPRF